LPPHETLTAEVYRTLHDPQAGLHAMSLVFFGAMQAFKSIFSWPTDQLDVDEGIRLGVTVTPAFFIYDRLIVGSSPHM
jgi:protein-disulfide isomerase